MPHGIDLGTTYSCIAYIDDSGRAVIAKNRLGEDTTPSVVMFEAGDSIVVGQTAKDFAKVEADSVVSLVKRDMGEEGIQYEFHGNTYTPESVSALILRELAEAATETTGVPVTEVVITVPAYFGVAEREATRRAGEIAGLTVLNLIPEPVAAALHYDALSDDSERTIMVYDLGGGTFDTTVIHLNGNDVNVVCTDGNHRLGGADWDDRVVEYLLEQFRNEYPDSDPEGDENLLQDLANNAEQLKKYLSQSESRPFNMVHAGQAARIELSREKFEELTSELLEETMRITERTIALAKEKGHDRFDEVLLVGGSTKMPAVATQLRERFGFEPKVHDPDLAVGKGAALFAIVSSIRVSLDDAGAAGQEEAVEEVARQTGLSPEQIVQLSEKSVTTVVPRAFGVKLIDSDDPNLERSFVAHLIEANTALPASPAPFRAATVANNQTEIKIEVWEQAGAVASQELEHNKPIGEGLISGLPPLPAGSPVDITFGMDPMGKLDVHAVELSTGKAVDFEIQVGGLTDEEVEEARGVIEGLSVRD